MLFCTNVGGPDHPLSIASWLHAMQGLAMTDAKLLKLWEEVVGCMEGWAADPSRCTEASWKVFDKVLLDKGIFTVLEGGQHSCTPGSKLMWKQLVLEKKVCCSSAFVQWWWKQLVKSVSRTVHCGIKWWWNKW